MKIWIAGGGVIGRRLASLLSSSGHEVTVATRTPARHALLHQAGAEPVACDALDEAALTNAVRHARPDVVVNQLTALPARINPRTIGRDLAATNRLRSQGARNLMHAARAADVRHVVAQSAAFAYAPSPGTPDTPRSEDDPLYLEAPGPFAGSVARPRPLRARHRGLGITSWASRSAGMVIFLDYPKPVMVWRVLR